MTLLREQFVIDALESAEDFPIDFNDVWKKLGYYEKRNALRRLQETHEEGLDFSLSMTKKAKGRPSQKVALTVDAFKSFCMVAETPQGREVRNYFIEVEKTYRKNLELQFKQPSQGYVRVDFDLLKQEQNKNDVLNFEVKKLSVQVESLITEVGKLTGLLNTAKRKLEIAERNQRSGQWGSDLSEESTGFTYDADYLFLITGIASRSYFVAKLFENFKLP